MDLLNLLEDARHNRDSRLRLFAAFKDTAKTAARKVHKSNKRFGAEFDDLCNNAYCFLWEIILKYDSKRNIPMGAFYYKMILRDLVLYCRKHAFRGVRCMLYRGDHKHFKVEMPSDSTDLYTDDKFSQYIIDNDINLDELLRLSVGQKTRIENYVQGLSEGENFTLKQVQDNTSTDYTQVSRMIVKFLHDKTVVRSNKRSDDNRIVFTKA